jgi:hypothetical protein
VIDSQIPNAAIAVDSKCFATSISSILICTIYSCLFLEDEADTASVRVIHSPAKDNSGINPGR